MLGPVEDSGLDKFMTQPADTGGAETQICYLFVADAVAHCARAKDSRRRDRARHRGCGQQRARLLLPRPRRARLEFRHLRSRGSGGRARRRIEPVLAAGLRGGLRRLAVAAGMVVVIIASAMVVGWALGVTDAAYLDLRTAASTSVAEAAAHPQQSSAGARGRRADGQGFQGAACQGARRAGGGGTLCAQRSGAAGPGACREGSRRACRQEARPSSPGASARERGTLASGALASADTERALEDVRQQLARERSALETAQRIAQEARDRLSMAERASDAVQEQLAAERSARGGGRARRPAGPPAAGEGAKVAKEAAERAAKEAREQEAKERVARRPSPPPRPRPVQSSQSGGKSFITWDQ